MLGVSPLFILAIAEASASPPDKSGNYNHLACVIQWREHLPRCRDREMRSLSHSLSIRLILQRCLPAPFGEIGEDSIDVLPSDFAEDCP